MPLEITTRWRDEPVLPEDYENLAPLISLARKARGRIVEFDWSFSEGELKRLQRAVFEWGSQVAGRYKCFDARVLATINDALGEAGSVFTLHEPRTSVDCSVTCAREGSHFRLRGHAPFDIVFGYGSAATRKHPEFTARLGPSVRESLASAVGQLGWDLRLLQEGRFQPVINTLYGLPLDYGIQGMVPPSAPAIDLAVHFLGPFSVVDDPSMRCLFDEEIAKRNGVYIWTIDVERSERPWYVGQTERGFGRRTGEHLANFLSGQYSTYDAEALSRGENRLAWDPGDRRWPHTLPGFLQNYETLVPKILALIRLLHVHVAPLDGDRHLYNRVEGAIGRHYKSHTEDSLRDFISPGLRLPAIVPFDRPIRLMLSSEGAIAGLPQHLQL